MFSNEEAIEKIDAYEAATTSRFSYVSFLQEVITLKFVAVVLVLKA